MFPVPVRLEYPASRRPHLLYGIILLTMLSYTVTMLGEDKLSFLAQTGFVPAQAAPLPWLLYPFLHLNHYHLIVNLAFLFLIGSGLEDVLGRARFLLLYLLSGLGAAALYLMLTPPHLGGVPLLGAAGAISGIFGAFLVLLPRRQTAIYLLLIVWPIRLFRSNGWWFTLLWFGYQLALTGVGAFGPWQLRTIPWALGGGLLTGALLAWLFVRLGVPREAEPPSPLPIAESNSMTPQAWGFIGIYLIFAIVSVMTLPVQLARLWEPAPRAPSGPVPLSQQPLTPQSAPALRLLAQWETGLQPERAALSADGHSLVLWEEQSLSFWDSQSGTRLATHERPPAWSWITFTPNNTLLMVEARADESERTEWTPVGEPLRTTRLPDLPNDWFALSPDGEQLAIPSSEGGLEVWRTEDGAQVANLVLDEPRSYLLEWSENGRFLIAGGWEDVDTLHLWQLPEAELVETIALGETLEAPSIALSPTGDSIALATPGGLELWDREGSRRYKVPLPTDDRPTELSFNPDGTLLATATAMGDIFVLDAATGTPLAFLHHPLQLDDPLPNYVFEFAFTSDGRLLSVDYLGTVRWWGIP